MADKTITAANSIYLLSITKLYPIPQLLQGYAADAAFETEASEPVETVKGVDGIMSAGFTPYLTKQTISIMPDSDTSRLFEDWAQAMKAIREVLYANAVITLPATQRSYVLTKGVLSSYMSIPGTRKVLQARQYTITWDDVSPVPL